MSKKIIIFVFLLIFTGFSFLCFSSCNLRKTYDTYGDFLYYIIYLDENGKEVAEKYGTSEFVRICGLSDEGKQKSVLVVPEYIDGIHVDQIGIPKGFLLGKYGWDSNRLIKVFVPFNVTISNVTFDHCTKLEKIIKTTNIKNKTDWLSIRFVNKYYLPGIDYDPNEELTNIYKDFGVDLYNFGNVSYMYNYENAKNDGYYWIDDYDYGEKIEYIPENPERDGYTFDGWYKEPECVNRWDFDADTLPKVKYTGDGEEIYQETKLYAKWIKK